MSRLGLVAALVLLGACEEERQAPPVQIDGAFDLAQAGEFVFVTSTDRSELRVLDIAGDVREFVRAPNPLHPLSVPVVERPVALGRDVRFVESRIDGGPYLYVRGAALAAISVVSSDRATGLREVARVATDGVVTAVAGRAPTAAGGNSTLYYSTYQGAQSALYEVELTPAAAPQPARLVTTFPAQGVNALLVLPAATELVVALRADAGHAGSTVVVDTQSGATRALAFPAPVKLLATHPAVPAQADPASPAIAAGTWVYGVLDEESCGGQPACSGLLAVDAATGAIASDFSGAPMLPILPALPGALVRGLEIGANVRLQHFERLTDDPDDGNATEKVVWPLVGFVTHADVTGTISYFDAARMRPIDAIQGFKCSDPTKPLDACNAPDDKGGTVELPVVSCVVEDCARALKDEFALTTGGGKKIPADSAPGRPQAFTLTPGKARDTVVEVIYRGVIVGLNDLRRAAGSGTTFSVPAELAPRIAVGDWVMLSDPASGGGSCPTPLTVASVGVDGTVTAAGPVPPDCEGMIRVSIRAEGAQPFVVFGGLAGLTDTDLVNPAGYMGRVGPGETFTFAGQAWHRPLEPTDLSQPELSFTMGPDLNYLVNGAPVPLSAEDRYQARIVTSWEQAHVRLFQGGAPLVLPASLYYLGQGDRQELYVAYPAANEVVSFDPIAATQGGNTKFVPFR